MDIIEKGNFRYFESKGGQEVLLLLHGLFGSTSNFDGLIKYFSDKYDVVVPILPIYTLPIHKLSVMGLVEHVIKFVEFRNFEKIHLVGNSLGGHIALLFALTRPDKVSSITLTGSSGLYESAMGNSYPKRSDYQFIKQKTEATFFEPAVATKQLVDEIFEIVNDRNKAVRVLITSKSAIRQNLSDRLYQIKAPTLLIWGKQDNVTPPFVGEKFKELIEDSQLYFINQCGHAPMMEHPKLFCQYLEKFLSELN